jgi:hypothetical protein
MRVGRPRSISEMTIYRQLPGESFAIKPTHRCAEQAVESLAIRQHRRIFVP